VSTLINVYDYYITPEEYAEAERNGVDKNNLNNRIRGAAWIKQTAITTPKGKHTVRSHMKVVWKTYGISYKRFLARVSLGWDEWSAATIPIRDKEESREQALWLCELKRKHPREFVVLAAKNGIKYQTFLYRVRNGWSYDLASTLPASPLNASMILKQKYGEDYCKNYMKGIKDWIFVKTKK
jgi:hypothetical protein